MKYIKFSGRQIDDDTVWKVQARVMGVERPQGGSIDGKKENGSKRAREPYLPSGKHHIKNPGITILQKGA